MLIALLKSPSPKISQKSNNQKWCASWAGLKLKPPKTSLFPGNIYRKRRRPIIFIEDTSLRRYLFNYYSSPPQTIVPPTYRPSHLLESGAVLVLSDIIIFLKRQVAMLSLNGCAWITRCVSLKRLSI